VDGPFWLQCRVRNYDSLDIFRAAAEKALQRRTEPTVANGAGLTSVRQQWPAERGFASSIKNNVTPSIANAPGLGACTKRSEYRRMRRVRAARATPP